jgi:hypothetical protein
MHTPMGVGGGGISVERKYITISTFTRLYRESTEDCTGASVKK